MFINHPGVFADVGHLNDEGAKIFSNMLIDDLDKTFEFKEKNTMQFCPTHAMANKGFSGMRTALHA